MRSLQQKPLARRQAVSAGLTLSQPGDRHEREADRLAEQMMRAPGAPGTRAEADGAAALLHAPAVPTRVPPGTGQSGRPLDAAARDWMEPRFGHDFSRVRVHDGGMAARSARAVQAHAYTLGHDIVFGAGRYAPHTQHGRHLIAHELTHVLQQTGALGPAPAQALQREPARWYTPTEADVTQAVIDGLQVHPVAGLDVDPAFAQLNPHPMEFQMRVLAALYDQHYFHGLLGYLAPGTKADRSLVVAIRFTQCAREPDALALEDVVEAQTFMAQGVIVPKALEEAAACLEAVRRQRVRRRQDERFDATVAPGFQSCKLKKGEMQWRLYAATSAGGKSSKQRMQIRFQPIEAYRGKTVTFLQTLREQGYGSSQATIDIGKNRGAFRPFYGADWNDQEQRWVPGDEGRDIGFRSEPSSPGNPAAYLFDEPFFFPPPHGRVFESVAVVPETGEALGALTWGVGEVPDDAAMPTCANRPSAAFDTAAQTFHTPQSPAPAAGAQNYDHVFDHYAPNAAGLTAPQKKQLDALAATATALAQQSSAEDTKGFLVVGGFSDAADADPVAAARQRAQTVADYLTAQGVPAVALSVRSYGTRWARHALDSQPAKQGRNRRVQIRLFRP